MEKPESAPATEQVAPKKSKRLWKVFLRTNAIILLLIVVLALINFRLLPGEGSALVEISPEITYATEPLKANGDIDYVRYLNERNFVPPEQNALAELVKILGSTFDEESLPEEFFQLLETSPPPQDGDHLVFLEPWLDATANGEEFQTTVKGVTLDSWQLQSVAYSPHPKGQLPLVDDWLKLNQKHLKAIRQAVQKPDYYMPYVGDSVFGVQTTIVPRMRDVARSLNVSAMGRLGDGDVAGAIDDQIAILRLGRHIGGHGFMIELLVGIAIDGIGQNSLAQTIDSGKCDAAQLQRLADALDSLPPPPRVEKQHLLFERTMGLDFVIGIGRYGPIPWNQNVWSLAPADPQNDTGFVDAIARSSVDWEVVCKEMNGYYDQLDSMFDSDDFVKQARKIRDNEKKFGVFSREFSNSVNLNKVLLGGRKGRGQATAGCIGDLLLPAVQQVFIAGTRASAYHTNTRIAVALELYRLENNTYPQTLDQLVPQFLSEVPLDPYSGKLPIYDSQKGDPYLLYSIGHNGIDDGGVSMEEAPYDESDLPFGLFLRTMDQWLDEYREDGQQDEID